MLFLYEFLFISLIARFWRTPRVETISTSKCTHCERTQGAAGGGAGAGADAVSSENL